MTTNPKDRRLVQYLLGQLPDADRIELEDRFFAEDALFEYLAAVETDLIDAYARGALAGVDRDQFERRLLPSPRFQTRIAIAIQLQARAAVAIAGAAVTAGPPVRETSPPKPARAAAPILSSRSASQNPIVGVIAASVAVGAAAFGWWMFQSKSSPAAGTTQSASAPIALETAPVPAPAAPPPPLTADKLTVTPPGPVGLVLAPGSSGSRESTALLTKQAGSEYVRIQIDHDGSPRERYAVIVSTRDRVRVWTELNMAARAQGATGVILQMPADALPNGDYLITLSGGTLQARRLEPLADYTVRVR
jgi:anti-sigma factor RsiW